MNLTSSVGELPFVGSIYETRLAKLGVTSVQDLLYHLPSRFLDFRLSTAISSIKAGDVINIEGVLTSLANQYTKSGRMLQLATIEDNSGKIEVVWFNQPYLTRTLREGMEVSLSGKADWFGRRLAFVSPEYEIMRGDTPIHTKGLVPIYPETAGISSKWLRRRIADALKKIEIEEFLPPEILEKYKLIEHKKAIHFVHQPQNPDEFDKGRRRLAFNELLLEQLKNIKRKGEWNKNKANAKLKIQKAKIDKFIKGLPFELTNSQKFVVDEILRDLEKQIPMNRLLEGDVGSGKTVVAAIAAYAALLNGKKAVFMAPTQILATQHANTLRVLFEKLNIEIALITSSSKPTSIKESSILVGTHALIHQKLDLKEVAFVVIDEQHRFGVEQRQHLISKIGPPVGEASKKNIAPHVLTMTATPIPRTIALTLYGDLALSTLKELPKGRQKITTWIVPPSKREGAHKWIDEQIVKDKIQAFVICPLIEESETLEVKSALKEAEELKKIFPDRKIDVLHGRLSSAKKDEVLGKFKSHLIDILVATPVVEVGIDVPNATIIVIEGGERFGLAQLHQLRGRVGRGSKKSYCLVFTESKSEKVTQRLDALKKAYSGFELAELDLKLRGPGEIFGSKQHGFSQLKVANWTDTELIRQSKEVAEDAALNPQKYPFLQELLELKVAS